MAAMKSWQSGSHMGVAPLLHPPHVISAIMTSSLGFILAEGYGCYSVSGKTVSLIQSGTSIVHGDRAR